MRKSVSCFECETGTFRVTVEAILSNNTSATLETFLTHPLQPIIDGDMLIEMDRIHNYNYDL